jgi:small-conductance mechanosensitive channel
MLSVFLRRANGGLEAEVEPVVESLLWGFGTFLAVLLVGLVPVRGLRRVLDARNPGNATLVEAVEGYTQLLVLVVAVAGALVAAGYGHVLSGPVLVVAAVTLAVGVAGQEVIGNLVSGLFLVADPDSNVGDWIAWEDQEGVVETSRFRVTRVRTPNNEVVTVPNTALATSVVRRPDSPPSEHELSGELRLDRDGGRTEREE